MRYIKQKAKKILISLLVCMQLVMCTVISFAEPYDPLIHGEAVAQEAKRYIDANKEKLVYIYGPPKPWGEDIGGTIAFDCKSFVNYMYQRSLGITEEWGDTGTIYTQMQNGTGPFDIIDESEARAGDVVVRNGHIVLYLGNNMAAQAGSSATRSLLWRVYLVK